MRGDAILCFPCTTGRTERRVRCANLCDGDKRREDAVRRNADQRRENGTVLLRTVCRTGGDTMTKAERRTNLLPGNVPKWIRCYDNGGGDEKGGTFDRYTCVFTHAQSFYPKNWHPYIGMSAHPCHPQGVGYHGENEFTPIDRPTYGHLGKRIMFLQLPRTVNDWY